MMAMDNVHFFGNVWLGSEQEASSKGCNCISIDSLQKHYSAVILAYGAISDRELGLAGEHSLKGIMPSRRVVDWYNGSLDNNLNIQKEFNLEQIEHLAIIGNGNIACDISRMLLKNVDEFTNSDAPTHVLETLRKSKLNTISMIARRGVTQAAFTTKEIKELCQLSNVPKFYILRDEWNDSMRSDASKLEALTRGIGRRTEYLQQDATWIESPEQYLDVMSKRERKVILRFLRNPVELVPDRNDPKKLGSVTLQKMALTGECERQIAVHSDLPDWPVYRELKCDALIKSIGYKSL